MASRVARSACGLSATAAASALARHSSSSSAASIGKMVRTANPGMRATIFGAYGFVGRYVTALLANSGIQCIIPYRGDDMEWRHLKVNGDVGIVAPMTFHPNDDDTIHRALEGSDIVINLIGKDYETKHYLPWMINFSYEDVNIRIAEKIARMSVQHGATTHIHVSSLAADPFALSRWARTKAAGEEAVRAACPGSVLIRPADVFGPEDRFLNLFASMHRLLPRLPLVENGSSRVQPIFVQDLAQAIYRVAVSEDAEFALGQTYDLAGPEEYTLREVVEYVFENVRAEKPDVLPLTPALADAFGFAAQQLPNPLVTRDRFARWQADVVLDELAPTKRLADLGIEASSMEQPGFNFLHRFRTGSHFLDMPGGKGQ